MPEFACPRCRAAIASDLIETTGSATCPFCASDLSGLGLPEPQSTSFDPIPDFSQIEPDGESPDRQLPRLPEKSQIKVIEATDDRLALYIPGGGTQANGLGCFALMWNGFMLCFTPPWIIAMFQGGNGGPGGKGDAPAYILIPLLALFWAVGLGIGWFWLRMKYGRTFLLVERHRLVVQHVLFNRKKVQETTLMPDSRAALVKAYEQNDKPVYRIHVNGQTGEATFGTALSDAEKDWIVDCINDFLDVVPVPVVSSVPSDPSQPPALAVVPDSCRSCGAPLAGKAVQGVLTCRHCGAVCRTEILVPGREIRDRYEPLEPADLPPFSPIQIDDNSPETLTFHYACVGSEPVRWLILAVTGIMALVWFGGFVGVGDLFGKGPAAPFNVVRFLIAIPGILAGLVPVSIGILSFWGRTTVTLTADRLLCRWHAGGVGLSRSVHTGAIDSIRVESMDAAGRNPRVRSDAPDNAAAQHKMCVVRAGDKVFWLTLFWPEKVARQVASLLRTRLDKLVLPSGSSR